MSILDQTRFIERIGFFDGQRLFASDLQGLEAFNREMRWFHNRTLHQPGIGAGFRLSGQTGERRVEIGAGYAIDALGREIVLTEELVEPVPPVVGEPDGKPAHYYLTVSYPDDVTLDVVETREGLCAERGAVRLRERPVLCWVRLVRDDGRLLVPQPQAGEIASAMKLVLGLVTVQECRLAAPVCVTQRRSARPSFLPRIVCDEDCSPRKRRYEAIEIGGTPAALVTFDVAVRKHDFCKTPCYLVRLSSTALVASHFGAIAFVETPTPAELHVAVVFGPDATGTRIAENAVDGLLATPNGFCIHWLAIES